MNSLDEDIVVCRLCPRLVDWREQVARDRKRAFANQEYWGRPVPNFGDPQADRLIVGLAPAAHGANRTGQMFTGDRSGDWLFRALHKAGVANMPRADTVADGLQLKGVLITAVAHCAPPQNKLLPSEIANCSGFLHRTLAMRSWKSILCLGSVAWRQTFRTLDLRTPPFGHGRLVQTEPGIKIVASFHPSQQNTFTGKLTEPMLDAAIAEWLA